MEVDPVALASKDCGGWGDRVQDGPTALGEVDEAGGA